MIFQRACIIETGTDLTDASWGLFNGVFAWATGRQIEGTPVYPLPEGFPAAQEDWGFGILAAEPFSGPSLACKIGPSGGYSTMGSLDVHIAKPGFAEFLELQGIFLNHKMVRHYVVVDGSFELRGVFCVDSKSYGVSGASLACTDIFRLIHGEIAATPVDPGEFPYATGELRNQTLPMALGYVNNAKFVDVGADQGRYVVYKNGNIERTITGMLEYDHSSANIRLIVGPVSSGFALPPHKFVGDTLVVTTGGNRQARIIKQFLLGGVDVHEGYDTILIKLDSPLGEGLGSGADGQPVPWLADQATDDDSGNESSSFEIWKFNQTKVLSEEKVGSLTPEEIDAFIGKLKSEYGRTFRPNSLASYKKQVELPETAGRTGAIFASGDAQDPDASEYEIISRYFKPAQIILKSDGNYLGGGFPSVGSPLPRLLDGIDIPEPEYVYRTLIQTKAPPHNAYYWSILMQVEIPDDFLLEDNEEVYMGIDSHLALTGSMDGLTNSDGFMKIAVCAMVDVGKTAFTPPISEALFINRPVNNTASLFSGNNPFPRSSSTVWENMTWASVKTLPPSYYSGEVVGEGQVPLSGQILVHRSLLPGANREVANETLRVTDIFKGNRTKSMLLEVKIKAHYPNGSHVAHLALSQLGFVITKKIKPNSDDVFHSIIGEKYGSGWSGRVPNVDHPVTGIPDIAEHVLRVKDGRPEWVDTDSFDEAKAFREAEGKQAWWAGRQLTEPEDSVNALDELMKNSMLLMVPGWDGKRRVVPWFDRKGAQPPVTLKADSFVENTLKSNVDSQSRDVYSEFELHYDLNNANGKYNKKLEINYTDRPNFPSSGGDWRTYVVGYDDLAEYGKAKALWEAAQRGYVSTGTPNRLKLELPWLPDPFNGDPWDQAVGSAGELPALPAAKALLPLLVDWAARPKRVARGELLLTPGNLDLKVGDIVFFQDKILTDDQRYYGWITSMEIARSSIPVEIVWYPFETPDVHYFMLLDDENHLILDAGSDQLKID